MTANNSIFGANARIIGFAWYELLEKFYSNPENEAKFQKWLKEKENKQNEKNIKFEQQTTKKKRAFSIVDLASLQLKFLFVAGGKPKLKKKQFSKAI